MDLYKWIDKDGHFLHFLQFPTNKQLQILSITELYKLKGDDFYFPKLSEIIKPGNMGAVWIVGQLRYRPTDQRTDPPPLEALWRA